LTPLRNERGKMDISNNAIKEDAPKFLKFMIVNKTHHRK